MFAKTTISSTPEYTENVLILNGKEEPFDTPRITNLMLHCEFYNNIVRSFSSDSVVFIGR